MPKIKFSALVTGMSGKANGSVFSTNNGGAYFRTNSFKSRTLSPLASTIKTNFKSVVSSWRSLSIDQQNAWRDAAPFFPRVNKFGDERIPSGYELFTSVNQSLRIAGLPPMVSPPSPRELPSLEGATLTALDQFQYIPQRAVVNYAGPADTDEHTLQIEGDLSSFFPYSDSCISMSFSISDNYKNSNFARPDITLFQASLASGGVMTIAIQFYGGYLGSIMVGVNDGTNTTTYKSESQEIDFSGVVNISFNSGSDFQSDFSIYMSGVRVPLLKILDNAVTVKAIDGQPYMFKTSDSLQTRVTFSRLTLYNGDQVSTRRIPYSLGYSYSDEYALVGADTVASSGRLVSVLDDFGVEISTNISTGFTGLLRPFVPNLAPYLSLSLPENLLPNLQVLVYSTPAVSFGRGGKGVRQRIIQRLDWGASTVSQLSNQWFTHYGNFPINGQINIELALFDSSTGLVSPLMIKPPKKKRFKAGAEMTNSTN